MIYAIVGKPGSGKSILLNYLTRRFLKQGERILTNQVINVEKYGLKKYSGQLYHLENINEFRYFDKGIIIIDEIEGYFESRDYHKLSPEDRTKFRQHRHERLDIYYSAEAFGRTDILIRQLTQEVIEVHNLFGRIFYYNSFGAYDYERSELTSERLNKLPRVFIRTPRISESYNSWQYERKREPYEFTKMVDYYNNNYRLKEFE